jgi:hypothetical protein
MSVDSKVMMANSKVKSTAVKILMLDSKVMMVVSKILAMDLLQH